MSDALYTPAVLRLAAEIPRIGRLARPDGAARRVSRVCGSEVEVQIALDVRGRIADLALDAAACALGQASASVLAAAAIGASADDIRAGREGLEAMLKGAPAPQGRFAALSALAHAAAYPARHASIRLAFEAAEAAFENARAETALTAT